jgi:hypothetical protein
MVASEPAEMLAIMPQSEPVPVHVPVHISDHVAICTGTYTGTGTGTCTRSGFLDTAMVKWSKLTDISTIFSNFNNKNIWYCSDGQDRISNFWNGHGQNSNLDLRTSIWPND